jgi:hypothetical protein
MSSIIDDFDAIRSRMPSAETQPTTLVALIAEERRAVVADVAATGVISEQLSPLRRSEPDTGELRTSDPELRGRHKSGLNRARHAVESDRFRELGLQAALWLANGAWSRSDDPLARTRRERPAADFAGDVLARRTRKILKKVDRVAELAPEKRHKLRIAQSRSCAMAATSSAACSAAGGRSSGARRSRRASSRCKGRSVSSTTSRRIGRFRGRRQASWPAAHRQNDVDASSLRRALFAVARCLSTCSRSTPEMKPIAKDFSAFFPSCRCASTTLLATHARTVSAVYSIAADGGRKRWRDTHLRRRAVAVRAEVGWVSLPLLQGRRQHRDAGEVRSGSGDQDSLPQLNRQLCGFDKCAGNWGRVPRVGRA